MGLLICGLGVRFPPGSPFTTPRQSVSYAVLASAVQGLASPRTRGSGTGAARPRAWKSRGQAQWFRDWLAGALGFVSRRLEHLEQTGTRPTCLLCDDDRAICRTCVLPRREHRQLRPLHRFSAVTCPACRTRR